MLGHTHSDPSEKQLELTMGEALHGLSSPLMLYGYNSQNRYQPGLPMVDEEAMGREHTGH